MIRRRATIHRNVLSLRLNDPSLRLNDPNPLSDQILLRAQNIPHQSVRGHRLGANTKIPRHAANDASFTY